jgi:hypothetical protein
VRTGFGGEHSLVFDQPLEGGHDGVDVSRRGERDGFTSVADPWVVQPATRRVRVELTQIRSGSPSELTLVRRTLSDMPVAYSIL